MLKKSTKPVLFTNPLGCLSILAIFTVSFMSVKVTYKIKNSSSLSPARKKSIRLVRRSSSSIAKVLSVKGQTDHGSKSFNFTFVSPIQQKKERNKAYAYFSID